MNPEVAVPLVLEVPIRPTPALARSIGANTPASTQTLKSGSAVTVPPVNPTTATYSNLTETEKQYLLYLQREFEHDRKKYEEKVKAMKELRVRIQETIKRDYLPYTYKCDTAHQMLVRLMGRFAPTDRARKQELVSEWRKLQEAPMGDHSDWLQQWEIVYDNCKAEGLLEVQGERPIEDFINAIHPIAPAFANAWEINLINGIGNANNFMETVRKYREFRRNTQYWEKLQDTHEAHTHKVFTDEALVGTTRSSSKGLCLCKQDHNFKDCPYLIQTKQPEGWKADPEIQTRIQSKLDNSEPLRAKIATIQSEAQGSDSDDDEPISP